VQPALKATWVTLELPEQKVTKALLALLATLELLEHRVIWALPEPLASKVTLVLQAQLEQKVIKV
jgi:hypothetical protein